MEVVLLRVAVVVDVEVVKVPVRPGCVALLAACFMVVAISAMWSVDVPLSVVWTIDGAFGGSVET